MKVAQKTTLPKQVYYDFDGLGDELQLVVNGAYSTLEAVKVDVLKALKAHAGAT